MTSLKKMAVASLAMIGSLFVPVVSPFVHAATSDSLTVVIRPLDKTPPAPVTDLQAIPGAVGQIMLQWSAPDENNGLYSDLNPVSSYVIRIATYSADSVGSTTTWWNSAQDVSGEPLPANPGTQEFLLLNGLSGGVTYYIAIISIDDMGLVSPIDTKTLTPGQQANAFVTSSLASPPSNFMGIALSTESIQWSWDLSPGATSYTLYTASDAVVQSVVGLQVIETGFTPNVPITRHLRSGNASGLSLPTSNVTVYTLSEVPNGLTVSSINLTSISLLWNANGNPAGTQYRLERSNNGVSFAPIAVLTGLTYTDTGLTELTSYYYRVRSVNGDARASAASTIVVALTRAGVDLLPPQAPAGLKGFLDPTGKAFTFTWEPVLYNVDGSSLTDLSGYYVYRRDTLFGAPVRVTPTPLSITAFADQVDGRIFYYTVRAIDKSGNESEDSLTTDSSPDANVIYISSDGVSHVMMPDEVNDLLRSAHNKYGVPLTVQMAEEPVVIDNHIVRSVRLTLVRVDTGEILNDLAFAKPQALVAVGYNSVNGNVAPGAPDLSGKSNVRALNVTPDQLSLYWFNGVTWVRIGGTLDTTLQSIKTKSSFLGTYQLRATANPSTLSLSQGNVYPRLFSPNGDGLNDRVYFVLENPNNVSVSGEIFDKDGRHVRTLPPPSTNTGIGTTLSWDGKDDRGNVVPGGAYIYKISGEGHTFTGTVGVAR